jgi:23S rRNA (uracil1939-C5)-methyltransferase
VSIKRALTTCTFQVVCYDLSAASDLARNVLRIMDMAQKPKNQHRYDQHMASQTRRQSGKKRATKSNQRACRLPRNTAPVEVKINHIGTRGDGVGKVCYTNNDNKGEHDVFVPGSLPGEMLVVQPLSLTSQGMKARIIELLSPSPDRNTPRCQSFPACGGCRFQHWSETAISDWKQNLVINFLSRANVPVGNIRPLYSSPPKSRRRANFHLKCLADGAIVGFRERMGQHIIALNNCVVLHPALLDLQAQIQQFASAHFPVGFNANAHANLLDQRGSKRNDDNICLYLQPTSNSQSFSPDLMVKLADWAAQLNLARLSVIDHGSPMTLFASELPFITFGKVAVSPPPGAFLQATRDGEAVLQDLVTEIAGSERRFVDLFSGCGTLSLPLLDQAAELLAVEQNEDALGALKAGADAAGLGGRTNVKPRNLYQAPLISDELAGFDMAIIDPPRSGAAAQCEMLAKATIEKIAMVSCNPASFARDAAILNNAGFSLDWVKVIDQFLFTNHLEIVGAFHR